MTVALWVVNALLALVFAGASIPKIIRSKQAVVTMGQKGVEDLHPVTVKLIGVVELLGAIGLIAPLLLQIAPILSPVAAVGLVLVMLGAMVVHTRRQESLVPNVELAVLAAASATLGFLVVLG